MNKIVRIGEPNIILQVLDELYDNIVSINSKYNTYGVKLDILINGSEHCLIDIYFENDLFNTIKIIGDTKDGNYSLDKIFNFDDKCKIHENTFKNVPINCFINNIERHKYVYVSHKIIERKGD